MITRLIFIDHFERLRVRLGRCFVELHGGTVWWDGLIDLVNFFMVYDF